MNPEALYNQAYQLRCNGQYAEAQSLLQRVLQMDPGHVNAQHQIALIQGFQGEFDESLAMLGKLSAQFPKNLEVKYDLAMTQMMLGMQDEAVRELQRDPRGRSHAREGAPAVGLLLDPGRPNAPSASGPAPPRTADRALARADGTCTRTVRRDPTDGSWNGPKPAQPWDVLMADSVLQSHVWRTLVLDAWGKGQLPLWNPTSLRGRRCSRTRSRAASTPRISSWVFFTFPPVSRGSS